MLEEGAVSMDKKSRQSSVPPKNGATSDSKKTDANSPNRFGKYGRKRESGVPRGGAPDFTRRGPTPQKCRSAGDKRPRSRGYFNDRQREEVAEPLGPEYGFPLLNSGSKKASLNHLLNFTFASRETNVSSFGGSRGGRRYSRTTGRVYNKERFLQANCQFVVGDGGDYTIHSLDADTLVDWNLVEQVRTLSHEPPTCPICLQEPQAGKITRCGHIFCWACILHYLELGDKTWRKCPICYDSITQEDLKSVQIRVVHAYQPGDTITMRLMKRDRGSTYSVPKCQWEHRDGIPHKIDDAVNTEFVKILVASPVQIKETILDPERRALKKHMETAEDSEICFIESAFVLLKAREESVRMREVTQRSKESVDEGPEPQTQSAQQTTPLSKLAIKSYTSAFSDKEDSDDDAKDTAKDLDDLDTPVKGENSGESVNCVSDTTLDNTLSDTNPETSPSPVDGASLSSEGEESVGQRARSSVSELFVGSAEEVPPPEIQRRLDEALPVEEAAAQLELPSESSRKQDWKRSNTPKTSFYYFQASDGQHIYLQSLNARCLMKEYGSMEDCPETITAVIVDTERIFMTEDLRKRLRYLNYLPLTCEFQVAELTLSPPLISRPTLRFFTDEFEKRKRMRQRKIRDDKKRSRKIEAEENAKIGKFPEMRISISSFSQFPSANVDVQSQVPASPAVAPESPLVSSLASSPPASPASGLSLESGSIFGGGSSEGPSDGEPTSMSFAQMLRDGKTKPQHAPVWPKVSETTPVKSPCSPGSDESDNEDRVPVPVYQDSFSSAIQAALETRDKTKGAAQPGSSGKKKKQKFTKLFATSMTRGK